MHQQPPPAYVIQRSQYTPTNYIIRIREQPPPKYVIQIKFYPQTNYVIQEQPPPICIPHHHVGLPFSQFSYKPQPPLLTPTLPHIQPQNQQIQTLNPLQQVVQSQVYQQELYPYIPIINKGQNNSSIQQKILPLHNYAPYQGQKSLIYLHNDQTIPKCKKTTSTLLQGYGKKSQNNEINPSSENRTQENVKQQSQISQESIIKNDSRKQKSPIKIQEGNSNQKQNSPLKQTNQSQIKQQQDEFFDQLKKLSQIIPTIKIFYENDIYYEGECDQQGGINGRGVMYNVLNTLFIPQPSFQWKRVEGFFIDGKIDGKAIYYDNANQEYKVEYKKGLFIRKID